MKKVKFLSFYLLILTCFSCQKKVLDFDSNPNITIKEKLEIIKRENSNTDLCKVFITTNNFKIHSEGLSMSIPVDSVERVIKKFNVNFTIDDLTSAIQTPFVIKNNVNIEPLKTINQYFNDFDGVYIGFGKPTGLNTKIEIYLTLVNITITENDEIIRENMNYFLQNNEKVIFRFVNNVWVRISESEMNTLKTNLPSSAGLTKGYFLGRNYFDQVSSEDKYIYIGFADSKLHLVVTNELLTQIVYNDEQGHQYMKINSNPSSKKSTFGKQMMSEYPIDKFKYKLCERDIGQIMAAACIRPCPSFCPEE